MTRPTVLIPACARKIDPHAYHTVQMKYVEAVAYGADCAPLILPALGELTDWESVLSVADGIMLTGSPSNVHPDNFGQSVLDPSLPLDPARDSTTLPLIRLAIEHGIPLIAVCRGAQEMNVALGGSLHQAVHEVAGKMDHRENKSAPLDEQYGPRHKIKITPGRRIASILGDVSEIMVNSLHGQSVDRLAIGLQIEAIAEDGVIEGFSVADSHGFTLAMQWHPEWKIRENLYSMQLFGAFGKACREFAKQK